MFWGGFFGNCHWNEWLVRPTNGHYNGPKCKKGRWECINTKMVHPILWFAPAKTSTVKKKEYQTHANLVREENSPYAKQRTTKSKINLAKLKCKLSALKL